MAVRPARSLLFLLLAACGGGSNTATCPAPLLDRIVDAGSVRFGAAVSAGPDADGDGHPDLVVGDPSPAQSVAFGAAYLVSGATGEVVRMWQSAEAGD